MMNVQEPPKPATASAMRSPKVASRFDHLVGIPRGPHPHELLRVVNLPSEHRQHVHAGVRLLPQQREDVFPVDLEAERVVDRDRVGLVRRLLEHRGEAEELADSRLSHHDVLVVVVYRGHLHRS